MDKKLAKKLIFVKYKNLSIRKKNDGKWRKNVIKYKKHNKKLGKSVRIEQNVNF